MHECRSGRQCSLASAIRVDPERIWFSAISFGVAHVERDTRLLFHFDDFIEEILTDQEKWFESVLSSKYGGSFKWKIRSDGDDAMGVSFLNHVIWWYPTSGRTDLESRTRHVAMMLRDLGLQK